MPRPISDRLSVVAAVLSESPKDAPRLARLAGFRGLLFDVWSANLSLPDLTASGRRDFVRLLASQDQQLIGLRMELGTKGISVGADVDREIARVDRALETAAGLSAPLLCIDLGPLPAPAVQPTPSKAIPPQQAGLIIIPEPVMVETAPRDPPKPPDPAFIAQVNAALTEIGSHADRYSVTIAFASSLSGFAALAQALSDVRCPWFGIDLDPVAILRDDWSRDEIFSSVGPLVRHVRARDAVLGDGRRIKPAPIGHGSIDWPDFLGVLDEAGYPGFLTIDTIDLPDRRRAAIHAAEVLRRLAP